MTALCYSSVGETETLGRHVFSRRAAARFRRRKGRVAHRTFLDPERDGLISVDRLDLGLETPAALARVAAAQRSGPFQGWATVVASSAASKGRTVRASPTEENPQHGDIVLPTRGDYGAMVGHAQELAEMAGFCEPPIIN